jgi:dolichol kinase
MCFLVDRNTLVHSSLLFFLSLQKRESVALLTEHVLVVSCPHLEKFSPRRLSLYFLKKLYKFETILRKFTVLVSSRKRKLERATPIRGETQTSMLHALLVFGTFFTLSRPRWPAVAASNNTQFHEVWMSTVKTKREKEKTLAMSGADCRQNKQNKFRGLVRQ